jgi:hypothetical protein
MLKLPINHKKRKASAEAVKIILKLSIISLFGNFWIEDLLDDQYQKIPIIIVLVFLISSLIILSPPIKKHREIGLLIFTDKSVQFLIYQKIEEINLENIDKFDVHISGHYFHDVSIFPNIRIASGTSNFIEIRTKNLASKKVEFFIDSERSLNHLKKQLRRFESKIDLKIYVNFAVRY